MVSNVMSGYGNTLKVIDRKLSSKWQFNTFSDKVHLYKKYGPRVQSWQCGSKSKQQPQNNSAPFTDLVSSTAGNGELILNSTGYE